MPSNSLQGPAPPVWRTTAWQHLDTKPSSCLRLAQPPHRCHTSAAATALHSALRLARCASSRCMASYRCGRPWHLHRHACSRHSCRQSDTCSALAPVPEDVLLHAAVTPGHRAAYSTQPPPFEPYTGTRLVVQGCMCACATTPHADEDCTWNIAWPGTCQRRCHSQTPPTATQPVPQHQAKSQAPCLA